MKERHDRWFTLKFRLKNPMSSKQRRQKNDPSVFAEIVSADFCAIKELKNARNCFRYI